VIAGAPSTTKSATAGVEEADAPRSRSPPKWVSCSQEYFYGSSAACGGQPNIEVDDGDGAGLGTSDIVEEDRDGADAGIDIEVDDGDGGDAVIDIMDKHFPLQACNALGFAAQSVEVGELHSLVTHLAPRQRERLICAVLRMLDARNDGR
jgi:hypothetical protein